MNKIVLFDKAVEIAKEAAGSGNGDPAYVLETTYAKMVEILTREGIKLWTSE